jgi:hypothetical protein
MNGEEEDAWLVKENTRPFCRILDMVQVAHWPKYVSCQEIRNLFRIHIGGSFLKFKDSSVLQH